MIVLSTEPPTVELEVSATAGIQLMAGKTLRIPAVVTGRPVPTRVWTIEEGELDKDRVVIENVGTKSELIIKEALRKDHGRYVITATNSCGSKSAAVRVEVFGEECYMDFYRFSSLVILSYYIDILVVVLFFRCPWSSS